MFHRWWAGVIVRSITVNRHVNTTLTNATVNSLLGDGSSALQTNDGAGDVSCGVAIARSGNVGTINTGNGVINTAAELSAVFGAAGNVKVVNDVNFCGGMFNTSIIGCGQTPGTSFITERFTASQEGLLWTHEFGHNQGLPHRTDTSDAIMFPSIGSNRRRVNQTECNAYRGSSALMASVVTETLPSSATMSGTGEAVAELAAEPMPGEAATPGQTGGMAAGMRRAPRPRRRCRRSRSS